MNIARTLVLALCLVGLAACGGNKAVPPPAAVAQVVIITQPLNGDFNAPLTIEVQFQDAAGNIVPSTLPVGLSLAPDPSNPVLTGTSLADAVAGTATFNDLFIDASGTFQLVARGGAGPFEVTSDPFTYGGPPFQLGFVGPVGPTSVFAPTPFNVEVQDKNGNPIPAAESVVIVNVVQNPSSLLMRAVHRPAPERVHFQWLEPLALFITQTVDYPQDTTLQDLVYHSLSDRVYSTDAAVGPGGTLPYQLYSTDPFTGDTFIVGPLDPTMVGFIPRALTEDFIGLLSGDHWDDRLYDVDPVTAAATAVGIGVQIPGDFAFGFFSMATHPITGENYAICLLGSSSFTYADRFLIRFDGATLQGTVIGPVLAGTSSISFFPNGALWATSGPGPSSVLGDSVYQMDPTSGAYLGGASPGGGSRGAAIATVPGAYFGTLTKTTVGGVADFTDLYFTASGSGFQLQASAPDLKPALSNTFTVNP